LRRQPRSSRDIIFVPLVSTTCGIPGQSKMTANEIPGICCDDSVCVCVRAYICIDKSFFFKKKKLFTCRRQRDLQVWPVPTKLRTGWSGIHYRI
jgi:hypothetical protein